MIGILSAIDETLHRNIRLDIGRAPVDGNGAGCKTIEDLLCDVPLDIFTILITDDKDLNISAEKKDALISAIQNWGTALVLRERERQEQAK